MRRDILVNGRFLSRRVTGVERYGREILRNGGNNYRLGETRLNGMAGHLWEQVNLPAKMRPNSILWSPANTGPLAVRNQALTIHDLSPLEHPEWFKRSFALWYRFFLPSLAKRVRVIFTPSNYVKQKVMARFGVENVIVTSNGVDTSVFHPGARQNKYEFSRKYILFVGSLQPRKNLTGLLQAWHEIKDEFSETWLVVAGEVGTVYRSVKFLVDEHVRFLNYVSDEDLPGLYAGAELFVLPSFDEGFGLPVLEALACGAPVLVSNRGALSETVGDAGFIFDLSKPDMLVTMLQNILCNNDLRLSMQEKGPARARTFSWKHTAELIWKTLNEI